MKCPICNHPLGLVDVGGELFRCFVCNSHFTEEFVIDMQRPDTRLDPATKEADNSLVNSFGSC